MSNETNISTNKTENVQVPSPEMPAQDSPIPETPTPHGKKRKWPIVVGVSAAVVVAAGAASAYWFLFRTPSFDTPIEAITSCITQLGDQFSPATLNTGELEKKLDTLSMQEDMLKKGQSIGGSITLESSDMSELSMLQGMSFDFSMANDLKNQTSSGSIGASIMGIGGNMAFYSDEDTFDISSKDFLPDAYLSVNKKEVSKLLEDMMSSEEAQQFSSLLEQQVPQLVADVQDFESYAVKELPDALVSFAKDWDIKKTKEDASIKINKQKYDCYTYEVSISSKDFEEFAEDYCTYLSKYDFEGNSFFSYLDNIYQEQEDTTDSLGDILKEGLSVLPSVIDGSEKETFDLELHISPKGQLLGLAFEVEEDSDSMKAELLFGGKNPGQETCFNMSGEIEGESFTYELSSKMTTKDDKDTAEANLTFDIGEEMSAVMNFTTTYNADDDSLSANLDASINADETATLSVTAEGKYTDIQKGKGYTLSYDSLQMSMTSGDESINAEFSGDLSMSVLEDKISKPEGKEYNLLKMEDADIEDLLNTLKKSPLLSGLLSDLTAEDLKNAITGALSALSEFSPEDAADALTGDISDETDENLDDIL